MSQELIPPDNLSQVEKIAFYIALEEYTSGATLFKPMDNSNQSSEFVVPYYHRFLFDASRLVKHSKNINIRRELWD